MSSKKEKDKNIHLVLCIYRVVYRKYYKRIYCLSSNLLDYPIHIVNIQVLIFF